jgi:ABC-type glycerol-3-phosphate transport system substrate-binding protein
MLKSGGPDIYELWGGWALDYIPSGALAKVPAEYSSRFASEYFPSTIGSFEYEGDYYGYPAEFNIEAGGLLVNKALFEELGLSYPTTWDEMINTAQRVSRSSGDIHDMHGLAFTSWDSVMYTLTCMMLSKGGNYFVNGHFNFASPEGIDAMTQMVSYIKDRKITNISELTGGDEPEAADILFEGRALMVVRGPWVLSEGEENYGLHVGQEIDYIEMPWYGPRKAFAAETGWGWAVAESCKNKEAAWKFLNFILEEENLVNHLIACRMIPAKRALVNNAKYIQALPFMKPLLGILDNGQYLGYFNSEVFKETINDVFVALCTTNEYASVREAMEALDEMLNEELLH